MDKRKNSNAFSIKAESTTEDFGAFLGGMGRRGLEKGQKRVVRHDVYRFELVLNITFWYKPTVQALIKEVRSK